jgi:O-antigen/teichoic acid export membrane protein
MPDKPVNRKRRLVKNSLYSVLSWIFPIMLALVVTPMIVRGLGNELYGLYAVILGFIGYSFTFGIGKTAAKYVSEYRVNGEHQKISEVVSATILLSLVIGIGGAVVVAAAANYIVTNVLLIPSELHHTAVVAVYLACATITALMISQVFQFILQGLHRFDRFLLLTNFAGFLLNIGSVILVLSGYGVVALVLWNLIVTVLIACLFYYTVSKLLPEFRFVFHIAPDIRRAVWRYAVSIIGYQIFGNVLLIFERAWIVRKFGAENLTFYVVPMTLGIYLHAFVSSLVIVLFPMLNELLAEREKLVQLYQKSSKIILTILSFAVVTSILCGRAFLGVWISGEFAAASYWILVIHISTFGIVAMATVAWQVAESFRAAYLNAVATFAWLIIGVPLMIELSGAWQINGVAIGRFTGALLFLPLMFYVERRFLGGIFWRFWGQTLLRIPLACALAALVEWICLSGIGPNWPGLLVSGIAGLAVYTSVLYFTGFVTEDERHVFREILRAETRV